MNTKKIISTVLTLSLCATPVCLSASAWKWPWQKESSYEQLLKAKKEWDSEKESFALLPDAFQEISSLKDNTCYLNNTDNVYFNKINDIYATAQGMLQKSISEYGDLMNNFDENNKDEQQCNALLKKSTEINDRLDKKLKILDQKFAKIAKEIPQAFLVAMYKDIQKIFDKYDPN